jgi:hypothetical protein
MGENSRCVVYTLNFSRFQVFLEVITITYQMILVEDGISLIFMVKIKKEKYYWPQ